MWGEGGHKVGQKGEKWIVLAQNNLSAETRDIPIPSYLKNHAQNEP